MDQSPLSDIQDIWASLAVQALKRPELAKTFSSPSHIAVEFNSRPHTLLSHGFRPFQTYHLRRTSFSTPNLAGPRT